MAVSDDQPLVSCLMVTADRPQLMRRSIRCYDRQTYPNRELVVIDDGETNLAPILEDLPEDEVTYVTLDPEIDHVLGTLRNVALDEASRCMRVPWRAHASAPPPSTAACRSSRVRWYQSSSSHWVR